MFQGALIWLPLSSQSYEGDACYKHTSNRNNNYFFYFGVRGHEAVYAVRNF